MPQISEERIQVVLPTPAKILTPAVVALLALMIAGFALLTYLHDFAINQLSLNHRSLLSGRLWQLVTYPFINNTCSLVSDGLAVLFFGSALEREWRAKSLLSLWLIVSLLCGILWTIVALIYERYTGTSLVAFSASPCAYGIIGAFGLVFRHRRFMIFFWTMEAQNLAWLLIAIGIIVGIGWPPMWVWVAGAAVAYGYLRLTWRVRNGGLRIGKPPERARFKDLG